jgi:hypothetical protein
MLLLQKGTYAWCCPQEGGKMEVTICQARVSHRTRKGDKDSMVVHCVPKASARAELHIG